MAASKKHNKAINRAEEKVAESAEVAEESWEARIAKVLRNVEVNLDTDRASVTDFIRLMQMLRECKEDSVKDVTVSWVDSAPVQ